MALSVAGSSSKAVAEVTNMSPIPSSSHTKCVYCKSAPDKLKASTDIMVIRSESATASSDVHVKPSVSVTSRTDGSSISGSNNNILEEQTASSSSGDPKATTSNPKVIGSVSDVLDATSKVIGNVGNEIAYLSEAADELISSLRDNIVSQSKGKARALSEQIQNLNEEMVYRNERAKTRARKLKKRGEELLWNTQEILKKRTEKAKKRAKELGKSVLESETWETYQKVSGGGGDNKKGQIGKQKKSKKGKENVKACRKESRRLLRNKRKALTVTDERCVWSLYPRFSFFLFQAFTSLSSLFTPNFCDISDRYYPSRIPLNEQLSYLICVYVK